MKSVYALLMGKVLVLAAGIFLSLTMSGCGDSVVADFEANRLRMGDDCKRELSQGVAAFTPINQTPTFRPAW